MQASSSPFDRFLQSVLASRFLTISAIIHILIIVPLGGRVLFTRYVEPPDFQESGEGGNGTQSNSDTTLPDTPEAALPPVPTLVAAPAAAPPAASLAALTSINTSNAGFSMPLPAIAPPTIGKALDQVTSTAPAQLPGALNAQLSLPGSMNGRGNARQRARSGLKFGALPASEPAVLRALRWLQSQQQSDGTWGADQYKGGLTGLALLCFLGHGETPQTSHEFGVVVNNAIAALVTEAGKKQGRMTFYGNGFSWAESPYSHAIATEALCEAYTMTKDESLVPVIRQAVDYIVKGQRPDGGWAGHYDLSPDGPDLPKSDTSLSGWQIQALKAAYFTGIPGMDTLVHPVLDNAMKNLDRVYDDKDGSFGLHKPGETAGHDLTGLAIASKLFWLGRPDMTVREGLKDITSVDLDYSGSTCNLYAWYFDTQACFEAQGVPWTWWKGRFQDQLTGKQSSDGSWPPTGGQEFGKLPTKPYANLAVDAGTDGPLYRTTFCCMMLEVFYRYLPSNAAAQMGGAAL
jgi:hypothetical protein